MAYTNKENNRYEMELYQSLAWVIEDCRKLEKLQSQRLKGFSMCKEILELQLFVKCKLQEFPELVDIEPSLARYQ